MDNNDNYNKYTSNAIKFFEFISKNKIIKSEENRKFTHTSLSYPKGSYELIDDNHRRFMDMYCKVISEKKTNIYMSEAHLQYGPIVIDIDIKYHLSHESHDHRYSIHDIELLMQIYNKYIRRYLNVSEDNFKTYLLEKAGPTLKERVIAHPDPTLPQDSKSVVTKEIFHYKDGVHIMYPDICTTPNLQYLIRDHVVKEIKQNGHWSNLMADNDLSDIIDKAVIEKNNWLMYGSSKPDCEANTYFLSKIYHFQKNDQVEVTTINDLSHIDIYELPKTLSIRKFNCNDVTPYSKDYDHEKIETLYQELACKGRKKTGNTTNAVIENEIRIAKKLVQLLGKMRADDYQQWIELGFCLHNIHDTLLETWIEFSSLDNPKYKVGECEKLWNNFKNVGFTIKSLYHWARNDNLTGYSDFMLEELNDVMKRSLSGTSYDVAKAYYELYKYNYACSSVKHKKWYEFKNHRWNEVDEGYTIFYRLNEEMVNAYLKLAQIFGNKAITVSGEEKDSLLTKQQQSLKLCKNLREVSFKKNIVVELCNLYYDPLFIERMDEGRKLLCFNNGVYDFENMIFRDGRPEDYITKCTHINYVVYNKNDPTTIEVLNFLHSIQEESDMQQHIIDFWTSCCQGDIPDEKFYIWTGTGGNGKSLTINLAQKTFGDYAGVLPITMLTNKRPPSTAASPELAKMKGVRFAMFQEAEHNDTVYVGHMKELTSNNDKVQARFLNENPTEFYLQAKLLLTCNVLPDLSSVDGGTMRRLRVVPFDMKFVDNPTQPHERKIDRKIKEKLPIWAESFMSILINNYQNYISNGILEPKKFLLLQKNINEIQISIWNISAQD